ncbi:malate synthase-related protein [Vibrio variabilis]|uniref:Malate synthase-related protein n=1 Tax=Vibrio variabilis TaxID=990271 RepID=A0ABQ0JMS7_9VIBR|nr:malate synthase-related protein [Vibrio variabilis]
MNMQTIDKTEQQNPQNFIAQAVFAVEMVDAGEMTQKQKMSKQLLDTLFPLENGSHEDVVSYEINYRHVQAYFKNGQHSGLRNNKHFVAYTGDECSPDNILFRDESGTHVEITIARRKKGTGCLEYVEIDDIQIETCTTFGATQEMGLRHWVSLVKGDEKRHPAASNEDKEYVAKNGDDYTLMFSYAA